jgi:hypothetical protein
MAAFRKDVLRLADQLILSCFVYNVDNLRNSLFLSLQRLMGKSMGLYFIVLLYSMLNFLFLELFLDAIVFIMQLFVILP